MKKFKVHYEGTGQGGRAVVIAGSEQEARELVNDHHRTTNFRDVSVEPLGNVRQGSVIFNWNGDPAMLKDDA